VTRPLNHLRNLAITTLAILVVLILATQPLPELVLAQAVVRFEQEEYEQTGNPGETVTFSTQLTLTNQSEDAERTFSIDVFDFPNDFEVVIPNPTITLQNNNQPVEVTVLVTIPDDEIQRIERGRIRARDVDDSDIEANAQLTIDITGPTPTPTNTPDRTDTPTPTEGLICEDAFEDDDERENARQIDVFVNQLHTICPQGDEDWLEFGGIAGKIYTISILEMDAGLDLTLELTDEDGNRLAFNDDFNVDRPNDLRPRIYLWQAPEDAKYFIRVRDVSGSGGPGREYVITLTGEGTGPTPSTISEVCLDLFEPDGLPEEARLITSNELHEARRLCPDGDADWVTFFGKTGKRYFLFTDTSRYRGPRSINDETQAGADTVLVLTDRDGVSILDINDDIPGGETLDSQIEFIPEVDGFYYAQVKNIGDIGNQYIVYDLFLQLCVPGQTDCGRTNPEDLPSLDTPTPTPDPADPNPSPTLQVTPVEEFTLDEVEDEELDTINYRAVPTPTSTARPEVRTVVPPFPFADATFEQMWQRNDQPVASKYVERSWMWGPDSLMIGEEAYTQAADGLRQVQYFDKARMETNASTGGATNGLLVQEMISGHIQVGDNDFVAHEAADIALAGDSNSDSTPTYASLHTLLEQTFADRTGEQVTEQLQRDGRITAYAGPTSSATRLAHFVPTTGHNIPTVFWQYLNAWGDVYEAGEFTRGPLLNWLQTVGYPISEPYWIRVSVAGEPQDVLVQAFERRVLTYTPTNPAEWQVEMGNVGRHYHQWRYGADLP
jgi:hypothetical protein